MSGQGRECSFEFTNLDHSEIRSQVALNATAVYGVGFAPDQTLRATLVDDGGTGIAADRLPTLVELVSSGVGSKALAKTRLGL